MQVILQQRMQHESIETSLWYFVGLDAQATTQTLDLASP